MSSNCQGGVIPFSPRRSRPKAEPYVCLKVGRWVLLSQNVFDLVLVALGGSGSSEAWLADVLASSVDGDRRK